MVHDLSAGGGWRLLGFGFPFSPSMPSAYTGLTNGPGVVNEVLDDLGGDLTLISRSAEFYLGDARISPLRWADAITAAGADAGSASCSFGAGAEDYQAIASNEGLLLEMIGRRGEQLGREALQPGWYGLDGRREALLNRVAYWSSVLETQGVDGYINSNCPHLVDDLIAYLLAEARGVPTVFPYRLPVVPGVSARLYIPASLFDHHCVHGPDGQLLAPEDIPNSVAMEPLPADLEAIYQRVVVGPLTLGELSAERLRERGEERPSQFSRPLVHPLLRGGLGWAASLVGPWRWKARGARRMMAREKENERRLAALVGEASVQRPFVFFPLHMQPEASTSPLGGFFSDQLRAIRLLAEALPVSWTLVVKEHPHQDLAHRPEGWYDAIVRTPGVVFVPTDADSDKLQREAEAVATVTGAAAWEAWLKGKPGIVLGHVLYQSAPGMFRVRTREDARDAIAAVHAGRKPAAAEIRAYLGRLAKLSFPGHLDAYIAPRLTLGQLDPDENDREIGRRLARTLRVKSAESGWHGRRRG